MDRHGAVRHSLLLLMYSCSDLFMLTLYSVKLIIMQGPVVTDNGNLILDWKFNPTKVNLLPV